MGATENEWKKKRFYDHRLSFKPREYENVN